MNDKKIHIYNLLQEVCNIATNQLNTTPIVYGSIGVELILNKDFDASDIDIILKDEIYFQKEKLDEVMIQNGYQLLDMPYHSYIKEGISIEFANFNYWQQTCQFINADFISVQQYNHLYVVLPLENQIKLYEYLTKHPTRSKLKKARDQLKLEALKHFKR